jgi:hypothetical protein
LRAARVAGDPLPVLVDVARVHRQHVSVTAEPVHGEIVDDAAVRMAEHGVLHLADVQHGGVVGGERLQRRERLRPLDFELAHVADVEEADCAADGAVLLDDTRVLHGHFPAAERHHAGAGLDVRVVERSALQRAVHERLSRPPTFGAGQGPERHRSC